MSQIDKMTDSEVEEATDLLSQYVRVIELKSYINSIKDVVILRKIDKALNQREEKLMEEADNLDVDS